VLDTTWSAAGVAIEPSAWAAGLAALERATRTALGDPRRPLLVSVRSGAPVSMPGMMETLLNIGLSDVTLPGFLRVCGNPRLAWDAYRRLVAGFGEVVMGIDGAVFEADLDRLCAGRDERELDFAELRALTRAHQVACLREARRPFPQDAHEQLRQAIDAVLASWQAPKARDYRRRHALPDALGTAVTVQRMVFGNAGSTSGSGVGFTRQPSTGEREPWIDFLFNAQGEDVVSGRRSACGHEELAAAAPAVWAELQAAMQRLEASFADMQDFEFTVESGRLWLLQTRDGKRTRVAQARIALDLHAEGVIDTAEALRRTQGLDAAALAVRVVAGSNGQALAPAACGVGAAHGTVVGEIALDEPRARARAAAGASVVLVRRDAETSDIGALDLAAGLLTARGARTSHAAVVARQMGKVCVVGCADLAIDLEARRVMLGATALDEGATLTLDGQGGRVFVGAVSTVEVVPADLLERLARLRDRSAPATGPGTCAPSRQPPAPVVS
jgi:pyruvate,orthophosphate dikinase